MISLSSIVNRSLAQAGDKQLTDDDIETKCEWCRKTLTISALIRDKAGPNLLHRCPQCEDVLLIISRFAEEVVTNTDRVTGQVSKATPFILHGWYIQSVTDLHFSDEMIIPRVAEGALRRYW